MIVLTPVVGKHLTGVELKEIVTNEYMMMYNLFWNEMEGSSSS